MADHRHSFFTTRPEAVVMLQELGWNGLAQFLDCRVGGGLNSQLRGLELEQAVENLSHTEPLAFGVPETGCYA